MDTVIVVGAGPVGLSCVTALLKRNVKVHWVIAPGQNWQPVKVTLADPSAHAPLKYALFSGDKGNRPFWGGRFTRISSDQLDCLLPGLSMLIVSGSMELREALRITNTAEDAEYWLHDSEMKKCFNNVIKNPNVQISEGWVVGIDTSGTTLKKLVLRNPMLNETSVLGSKIFFCCGGIGNAMLMNMLDPSILSCSYSGHFSFALKASKKNVKSLKARHLLKRIYTKGVFKKNLLINSMDGNLGVYVSVRSDSGSKNFIKNLAILMMNNRFLKGWIKSPIIKQYLQKSRRSIKLRDVLTDFKLFDICVVLDLLVQKIYLQRSMLLPLESESSSLNLNFQISVDERNFGKIIFHNHDSVCIKANSIGDVDHLYKRFSDIYHELLSRGIMSEKVTLNEFKNLITNSIDGYHQFSTAYTECGKFLLNDDLSFRSQKDIHFVSTGNFKYGVIPFPTIACCSMAFGLVDRLYGPELNK